MNTINRKKWWDELGEERRKDVEAERQQLRCA